MKRGAVMFGAQVALHVVDGRVQCDVAQRRLDARADGKEDAAVVEGDKEQHAVLLYNKQHRLKPNGLLFEQVRYKTCF